MTTATRKRVPWYEAPPPHIPKRRPRKRDADYCVCGDPRVLHTRRVMAIVKRLVVHGRPPQASDTGCTACACSIYEPNDGTASALGSCPEGCSMDYQGRYDGNAVGAGLRGL